MPQRSQFVCSRCGADIGHDYPETPVVTYITTGAIGGGQEVDADALNPGIEAMLMLATSRVELCPGCVVTVLDFDAGFVDAMIETANREELRRGRSTEADRERLRARRERVRTRIAEDARRLTRMTKTEAKAAPVTDKEVQPLLVGDLAPERPKVFPEDEEK